MYNNVMRNNMKHLLGLLCALLHKSCCMVRKHAIWRAHDTDVYDINNEPGSYNTMWDNNTVLHRT